MKRISLITCTLALLTVFSNCNKNKEVAPGANPANTTAYNRSVYSSFPENFESGSKGAYAAGAVTLTTGSWYMDDALIGSTTSDRKNGAKSVRMQNTGKITMQFNVTSGAYQVSIAHGVYGTDASSTWSLWYSTNSGSTWAQTGSNVTTGSTTLSTATFSMSVSGNVRFELRKLSGGRLNIDDFSITDNTSGGSTTDTIPTRDSNMAMGNPSGATTSTSNYNNFLMNKTGYSLSYNNAKGKANWVSWHLSRAWKGSATRCDCFTQDGSLPAGYYRASTSNYTSTGFDRGHMCPSDDRDGSAANNSETFLMTNIAPQAPKCNQITWESLEEYCRSLIYSGNELYIIAGTYGTGGSGSSGGTTNTIASGNITVPGNCWKIIVVLPVGINDVSRVSSSTRIIAVNMPNTQSITSHSWDYYRTSVDAIESATGYDFLSNISTAIQSSIESTTDAVTIP